MEIFGQTNQGRVRSNNEDAFATSKWESGGLKGFAVVADGMGGHNCGEVASAKAIEFFSEYISDKEVSPANIMDFLNEAVQYSNKLVYQMSLSDSKYYGMGTTFTACVFSDDKLYVVHVGDSRLYIADNKSLFQFTTDHTYINEMIRAGLLTYEEAMIHPKRNALTKAVGVDENVEVDGYIYEKTEDFTVLLCSDGLTNMLSDEEIYEIIKSENELSACAQKLIARANEEGGVDNITVILAKA